MPRATSIRRYAQAIFEIALENNQLDKWLEDLRLLALAVKTEGLARPLDSPQVSTERKIGLIEEVFGDTVSKLSRNLISLLATRNMVRVMPAIADEYVTYMDSHRGVERANVVTAVSIDDEQQAKLSALLREIIGREVILTTTVDPKILGGVVARLGDRIIDGSTRTRLENLRRYLLDKAN